MPFYNDLPDTFYVFILRQITAGLRWRKQLCLQAATPNIKNSIVKNDTNVNHIDVIGMDEMVAFSEKLEFNPSVVPL